MRGAYYNEIDPYAAQWLRNLIAAGHIAPGDVDERSILDVSPADLAGYVQCHFFAGIGAWSFALRQGGWLDSSPVWTGSCPCQPFSVAGMGGGMDDERHLWPYWFHLVEQCRPPVVFGEQVEAAIRHGWLDLVQADMEGIGYAFAAVGAPAAGVGAPHIRQRLWFVADDRGGELQGYARRQPSGELAHLGEAGELAHCDGDGSQPTAGREFRTDAEHDAEPCGGARRLGNDDDARLEGFAGHGDERPGRARPAGSVAEAGESGGVADCDSHQPGTQRGNAGEVRGLPQSECEPEHGAAVLGGSGAACRTRPTDGHWRAADWIFCRDGKWRPVEPGTFPLAHGAPARVGRLRAYGNAIVPQVATELIRAYMECRP